MNQQNLGQGNNAQPNNSGNNSNSGGNPAWQEYLADIPEAIRPVVISAFQKWDANVTQRFQQIQQQVEPLKQYAALAQNGIPLDRVVQSLQFADAVEKDPAEMIKRIQTTFNVQLPQTNQQQAVTPDPYSFDEGSNMSVANQDISQHPMFQQMMQTMQALQTKFDEDARSRQEQDEADRFEELLDNLVAGKPHLENNDDARMMIAAFMSQGVTAEDALNRVDPLYLNQAANSVTQQVINPQTENGQQPPANTNNLLDFIRGQQNSNSGGNEEGQAPVVMGGAGTVGSGTPSQTIDFGNMKSDDVNEVVAAMLQAGNNS